MTKSNKNIVEPYFKDDDETTLQNFPRIKTVQEEENCLDTHVRRKKLIVQILQQQQQKKKSLFPTQNTNSINIPKNV